MTLRPVKDDVTHISDDEGYLRELSDDDRAKLVNVKERIKKLLAVGKDDRNISSQEMDGAMNLAVALARKNGLDLYRIEREMRQGGAGSAFVVREMELEGHSNWRALLVSVIARALICRILTHTQTVYGKPNKRTGNRSRHPRADYVSIVGMPGDIELVDYLYTFITRELTRQVNWLFKEDDRNYYRANYEHLNGKRYRDEFYRGAVHALESRLKKLFTEERAGKVVDADDRAYTDGAEDWDAPVPEQMALVPLKEADVENAMKEHFPNTTKGRDLWSKQRSQDGEDDVVYTHQAFMAGHAAANNLKLHKALTDRVTAGALD